MGGGANLVLGGQWVAVPMAAVLPALWMRGRRAGLETPELLARLAFAAWVGALVALALFPLPLPPYAATEAPADYRGWPYPWASLVPFDTIRDSIGGMWDLGAGRLLLGNIAAFLPLGVLAPIVSTRFRSWPRAVVLGVAVSLAVELTQLGLSLAMTFPWRFADVDDVLLNTLGTVLGYAAWTLAAVVSRHPAE